MPISPLCVRNTLGVTYSQVHGRQQSFSANTKSSSISTPANTMRVNLARTSPHQDLTGLIPATVIMVYGLWVSGGMLLKEWQAY